MAALNHVANSTRFPDVRAGCLFKLYPHLGADLSPNWIPNAPRVGAGPPSRAWPARCAATRRWAAAPTAASPAPLMLPRRDLGGDPRAGSRLVRRQRTRTRPGSAQECLGYHFPSGCCGQRGGLGTSGRGRWLCTCFGCAQSCWALLRRGGGASVGLLTRRASMCGTVSAARDPGPGLAICPRLTALCHVAAAGDVHAMPDVYTNRAVYPFSAFFDALRHQSDGAGALAGGEGAAELPPFLASAAASALDGGVPPPRSGSRGRPRSARCAASSFSGSRAAAAAAIPAGGRPPQPAPPRRSGRHPARPPARVRDVGQPQLVHLCGSGAPQEEALPFRDLHACACALCTGRSGSRGRWTAGAPARRIVEIGAADRLPYARTGSHTVAGADGVPP